MSSNRNAKHNRRAPKQEQKSESEVAAQKLIKDIDEREKVSSPNNEAKSESQNVTAKPYHSSRRDKILVWFDLKKQLLTASLPILLSFVVLIG